jgi:hypothetical protein
LGDRIASRLLKWHRDGVVARELFEAIPTHRAETVMAAREPSPGDSCRLLRRLGTVTLGRRARTNGRCPQPGAGSAPAARLTSARRCSRKARSEVDAEAIAAEFVGGSH